VWRGPRLAGWLNYCFRFPAPIGGGGGVGKVGERGRISGVEERDRFFWGRLGFVGVVPSGEMSGGVSWIRLMDELPYV